MSDDKNIDTQLNGVIDPMISVEPDAALHDVPHIENMYRSWFLDYASYVILDRAVPNVEDGLKPVQRRILHAMEELDDSRFNKAANIIGHTMRYHPHGDAAISEALVKLAQKDLLIDTQGNWGNTVTGDRAAASRYIEARLSKFAKEVVFNKQTTGWQLSYDGRNREPQCLPVKFPLLLALGTEGIAVGLSTKILPHNFIELIKGSIAILSGKKPTIYPDFLSGGIADFSGYKDGRKGSRIRVRSEISVVDARTLRISEIPFGVTTSSLIESILLANDKGKIKIKQVEDNTSNAVEIIVRLPQGASPEQTIDALYAFTDCEASISPSCCIIRNDRPEFCGVSDILNDSTQQTVQLLKQELEIRRAEVLDKLHFVTLEKIFIENRVYRKIENSETWQDVLKTIAKGLQPFSDKFIRDIVEDDLVRLTEIKIKRISKFDSDQAGETLKKLNSELADVRKNLKNLTDYAILYFKHLLKTYGKGKDRRTRMDVFGAVQAAAVAVANQKIYLDRKEGFIGTSLKKDEFIADCSDFDDVIVFCSDGKFVVTKVSPKVFVGRNIIHAAIFRKEDERRIYHLIYQDGKEGAVYAKRFNVTSITRDRVYDLTKNTKASKLLYLSINPNGEAEKVRVLLVAKPRLKKAYLDFDFSHLPIKVRGVMGYMVTKHAVRSVKQLEKGESTLDAMPIWYDRISGRLSREKQGDYLGEFQADDKIAVIYKSGACELTDFNLMNHYGDEVLEMCKHKEGMVISVIYYDGERQDTYVKRFEVDAELFNKRQDFVGMDNKAKVLMATFHESPQVKLTFKKIKGAELADELISICDFVEIKGHKAVGVKLSRNPIKQIAIITN